MKTSKKILGATLALSLIIPLSGCGGSEYAVKGCKPTDNFPCVPADENDLPTSTEEAISEETGPVILGVDVKAGSTITLKGDDFADIYFYLLDGPSENAKKKKLIIEDGRNNIYLKNESEVEIELPEEAIGKYVMLEVVDGGPNRGRFQIVDVE